MQENEAKQQTFFVYTSELVDIVYCSSWKVIWSRLLLLLLCSVDMSLNDCVESINNKLNETFINLDVHNLSLKANRTKEIIFSSRPEGIRQTFWQF